MSVVKEQLIMERDEYNNWVETKESIKNRLALKTGFDASKIEIQDSSARNGETTSASFTFNGWGFSFDFDYGWFERSSAYDQRNEA